MMKRKFSYTGDILLVFLLCAALVSLVSLTGKERSNLTFDSAFRSSASLLRDQQHPSSKPVKRKKKETSFLRKFSWVDPAKKERETVFEISASALNDEIKKFGRPRSMTHPLLIQRRGFKIIGRRDYIRNKQVHEKFFTVVDYQQIFQRNIKYFLGLTRTLMTSAELSVDDNPLLSFLYFVQHIPYRRPPDYYRGKFINSFFVPLVCLYEQYGDCDSKSLLLSEFLAAFPGSTTKAAMVLVRGRGLSHVVLGVKGRPYPGMTALYFPRKGYYIVHETTTTGWSPGFVDRRVLDALKAGYFHFVELN
jgi:hypothetical protein